MGFIVLLLGAALFAMGCGKEKEGLDEKYHGQWQRAGLVEQTDTLIALSCRLNGLNSKQYFASFDKKTYSFEEILWVGSKECKGDNKITQIKFGKLADLKKTDSSQVLRIDGSQKFKATITGDVAVATLNTVRTCGRTDWAAGEYTQDSERIEECTRANTTSNYLDPLESNIAISKIRMRFIKERGGLSISTNKDESTYDSAFRAVNTTYWLKR